jgi:CBS domain-containing protein
MLTSKNLKELMVPISEYPHIHHGGTIREAFGILDKNYREGNLYRTVLVLDDENSLKGMLTMRDMIQAVVPGFLKTKSSSYKGLQPYQASEQDYSSLALIWGEDFDEQCRKEAGLKVEDVMTVIDKTVTVKETIAKCAYLLVTHDVPVMPVTEENRVVGAVRLVDLFRKVVKIVIEG